MSSEEISGFASDGQFGLRRVPLKRERELFPSGTVSSWGIGALAGVVTNHPITGCALGSWAL
mgnify:CR=1 FL=1